MSKRPPNFQVKDETTGYGGDPLDSYIDGSSFNILQFIAEGDTPQDSPQTLRHIHQQQPQDPHHGGNRNMMYHQTGRLPDSPPITEVSAPGSSASPHSSNSDSPYSPNEYHQYGIIPGHNGNGLILAATDLHQNMIPHTTDIFQQQIGMNGGRLIQPNPLNSPTNMSYTNYPQQPTPASMTQVSPQPVNQRINGNYYDSMMYQSNSGSDGSINSAGIPSKKRARVGPNMGMIPQHNPLQQILSPTCTDYDENMYHTSEKMIQFAEYKPETWQPLFDVNHQQLSHLVTHVVADKGFNYSAMDSCFVNQKKNHFQITVNIEAADSLPARFVRVNGELKPITEFRIGFAGVKWELQTSEVAIKQSQTDRKPQPHTPVKFDFKERQLTKVTVPRLHFSETTMSNQRKGGKPNPDQRYFILIVRLFAVTEQNEQIIFQMFASEKVIVRATNPGQFEQPDVDFNFTKSGEVMIYPGKMVIGGDKAIENTSALSVHGNVTISGTYSRPSDIRLKENIFPVDKDQAVERFQKYEIVTYDYKPEIAEAWKLNDSNKGRAGMIAQQLREVYPEAVTSNGEFLAIDENRLFFDNMVVTKELMHLTQELDKKIVDNVEELQKRIKFLMRKKQLLGSIASGLSDATSGIADSKSYISLSQPSLFDPKEKRNKRKQCHNPSCHRNEPLCNSKFTQGTIVALVVIMAACLLAMSALYILDWHNRNNNFNSVYDLESHRQKDKKPSIDDSHGEMRNGENHWVPESQPGILPLMGVCRQSQCQRYCCSDPFKYKQSEKIGEDEPDGIVALATHQQAFDKRSVSSSSFNPDHVSIEILNMNVTLGDSYCYNSCSKQRGRFNYYIPISSYMPTIPLMIRINTPRGRIVNNCGYLSQFQEKPCPMMSHDSGVSSHQTRPPPYATQVSENIFEVSAGSFMQSAYRFRVGYTTEACYSPGVFDEFNLVFYRTCFSSSAILQKTQAKNQIASTLIKE